MSVPSIEELQEKIENCLNDRSCMLGLIQRIYSNASNYPTSEPYSQIFKNLIDNRVIEHDEITEEYKNGLIQFHEELLACREQCLNKTPKKLLDEKCIISDTAYEIFKTDFIVACTIRNWEVLQKIGFTEDEAASLEHLIKFVFYSEKARESNDKLQKLSYHSLFDDPPLESIAV